MKRPWTAYVEGESDRPVVSRLAAATGLALGSVISLDGVSVLDSTLRGLLASASQERPVLVLRDVDPTLPNFKGQRFARCASTALETLAVPNRAEGFCLRLARHEMEAWLLADHRGFSRWLGVSQSVLPPEPDELKKASVAIVELARRSDAKRALAEALVPAAGAQTEFGARFELAISQFARTQWDPRRAAARSPSLARCLRALRALAT